eukprot:s13349_g1.t1
MDKFSAFASGEEDLLSAYGTLEEKVLPSKEYLERKLLEVEHGEFKPESLQEVTTRDELDPDTLIPVWDSKGQMTVKRGTSRVPLPAGPEELRRRLNIMRNVYLMLKLKFPGRSDLQDLTPELFERYKEYLLGDYVYNLQARDSSDNVELFERYKEYLLGDYVYNLQARDSSDNVVHTPPWQLVLAYEQAVRKQAFHYMVLDSLSIAAAWEKAWKDPAFHYMVLDSLSIAAAWEKAWKDPVTKERHFSTPLSLYSKRKPADPTMPTRDT